MKINFLFALLITCPLLHAAETKDPYSGKEKMNGFRMSDFKGFEKKWHFVTVRFRKDTGEMRMVYANEIAWKALLKNTKDYPDGSVLAKIGLATQDDPTFVSSAVPSGARRYQFMIRDKKKYESTYGWTYALFDENGKSFPGEPVAATYACAACHHIVPDRGEVFSQPLILTPFLTKSDKDTSAVFQSRLKFETYAIEKLDQRFRDLLPMDEKYARVLKGELANHLFQGTLDEIRPSLASEVSTSKLPSLLESNDHQQFSLVFINKDEKKCSEKNPPEIDMIGIGKHNKADEKLITIKFCFPNPKAIAK